MAKKLAESLMKNRGRVLEIGAKFGSAAVYKNSKAAFSTFSAVINFYPTSQRLDLGKIVHIKFIYIDVFNFHF